MELKITPSGQTIVKPTALGPGANTDTKLLIYGLFQEGRVLAQDGIRLGRQQSIAEAPQPQERLALKEELDPELDPSRHIRLVERVFNLELDPGAAAELDDHHRPVDGVGDAVPETRSRSQGVIARPLYQNKLDKAASLPKRILSA